jgi:hypothetical protein
MFVMRHGGASNRPGTEFVGEVNDSTKTVRLIPFVFNSSQTYILEFGDQYMRVIRDAVVLSDLTLTITAITNANPAVLTYTGTDPVSGDEIYISGITGAIGTYLNGRNFKIANVNTGANTLELKYMSNANVNSTTFGSYTSGGTAERIYQIVSPYAEADLSELQFVQSADVITIVHPNYAPRELARTGHTAWAFSTKSFVQGITKPIIGSVTASGTTGSTTYTYKVTAIDDETFEESPPSDVGTVTNGNATISVANFITINWTAPVTGTPIEYNVYKGLNGVYGFIGVAVGTSFVDNGITPLTSDSPPSIRNPFPSANISAITKANPAVVTATAHGFSNGDSVIISGVVGMTQVNNLTFTVANKATNTFELSGINSTGYTTYVSGGNALKSGYGPSTVSYFQQRLIFANTDNDPEKVWASRTGQFTNFTTSQPIQDDDSITFTLAGRQVNEVRHILDLGKLLILTSGGEWACLGDVAGILKPTDVNSKEYSYNGSGDLAPIIVSENALYVQARGTIVRDLGFDYQIDGYRGNDLTIFAAHLFDNYTLVDWTYQQIPHSVVWGARSDGTLLGLTYIREHQVFGWHRHDFPGGSVENVCSVPEGNEDALYVVIQRTIDGRDVRYIERMSSRLINDVIDNNFTDCSLAYDGTNTGSRTMTLSGGTDWDYLETLTLTASTSFFVSTDVGNQIQLTGSDGTLIRFTINAYTSGTVVTGKAHKTVPAAMRSVAITSWVKAVDDISGLWHLEGEDVSVFADRFVVASPNNASYDTLTVTNGAITLDKPYGIIKVGLPFISDVETLDIDSAQGETIADKKKLVSRVTIFVESSRGIWVGAKPPTDDSVDPLEDLVEEKIRNQESYDDPVALATGTVEINIKPEWNSNGRIFIRQVDPVPLSVLAVAPAGLLPFKTGGSNG